jgi:hypothetical protein
MARGDMSVAWDLNAERRCTPEKGVGLTTSILGARYCVDDGSRSLEIKLGLHYANTGPRPLILYKPSSTAYYEFVSHTEAEALAHKYEVNSSLMIITSGLLPDLEGDLPGPLFAILQPGRSYDTYTEVRLLLAPTDKPPPGPGRVPPGEHVLQVTIPTWPADGEMASRLTRLWREQGDLWTSSVTSEPMPFTVEDGREEDCSSPLGSPQPGPRPEIDRSAIAGHRVLEIFDENRDYRVANGTLQAIPTWDRGFGSTPVTERWSTIGCQLI